MDVASYVDQVAEAAFLTADLRDRTQQLESEMFAREGMVQTAKREIADLDVAMASDRDRVTKLDQQIEGINMRMRDTPATSPALSRGGTMRSGKGASMSLGGMGKDVEFPLTEEPWEIKKPMQ